MAGIGGRSMVRGDRRAFRCAIVLTGFVLTALMLGPAALGQVPPTPELPAIPELPPEIVDAIAQAEDTLIPILLQGAAAADPAANAAGFALRPGCSAVALPLVLLVQAARDVPMSVGPMTSPLFVMCGAAALDGPADGVFAQVDGAAGGQLESSVQPGLDQVHEGIQPATPNLNEACGAIAVFGTAPNQVPAPFSRFDMTEVLCGT